MSAPAPKRRRRWIPVVALSVIGALLGLYLYASHTWRAVPTFADPTGALRLMEETISRQPRTLIVAAHPDDVEWYMGGTVARLTAVGAQVTLVMATNGEAGRGPQPGLGATRRAEQVEAAQRLGVTDVVFLELPDGGLHRRTEQLGELVRDAWRVIQPELVFSFDAALVRPPYIHRDHQAVGRAVAQIAGEDLGRQATVLLFHTRQPDVLSDISAVFDQKMHALSAHRTQMGGGSPASMHRGMAGALGEQAGVQYAESFRLLPAR